MNAITRPELYDDLLWFGNTLISIRLSSAAGADGTCIIEQWLPYGEAPPLHVHHREDEIFHILAGEVRFRVGEKDLVGRAGDILLAPKGVPHGFRVESSDGAHLLTITRGADFETMVTEMSRPASRPGLPDASAPTPDMIAALTTCCAVNHIELLGPPLS